VLPTALLGLDADRNRPQDRPEPLVEVQLDFKDVVQVDPLVSAKQTHAVEVFDAVDVGTSLWLMGEPSASYTHGMRNEVEDR
jgi:hypothetical protein